MRFGILSAARSARYAVPADEAFSAIEQSGETWCESDVHRIAGEIAWLAPEPDISKAETHFEQALAIARQQQAKSWELRAAMSLARLWRDRGECVTARELLAGLYDWFREGFETLDLQRARMLLAMLTAQAGLPIPHSEHVARGQNLRGCQS